MMPLILVALLSQSLPSIVQAEGPVMNPRLGGTVVPGICLLSRPAVIARSKVGIAATTRLKQLAQQANAEVDADRKPIEADRETYRAEVASLSPAQRQEREQSLGKRFQAVQRKATLRGREIEATRVKALSRIATEMQPVVEQAYLARACGLLVDRTAVLGGNMANDLTPVVVQGLDARMASITFDRETLSEPTSPQP